MAELEEKLRLATIIPYFDLPSARGRSIKSWDYKQRKNMLIYFFSGAGCEECRQTLKMLAENYQRYERLNTEVIAIGVDELPQLRELARELDISFPVLADAAGATAATYTHVDPSTGKPRPSIFLTDRYGALEGEWVAEREEDLPDQDELLANLQLLELRCPE